VPRWCHHECLHQDAQFRQRNGAGPSRPLGRWARRTVCPQVRRLLGVLRHTSLNTGARFLPSLSTPPRFPWSVDRPPSPCRRYPGWTPRNWRALGCAPPRIRPLLWRGAQPALCAVRHARAPARVISVPFSGPPLAARRRVQPGVPTEPERRAERLGYDRLVIGGSSYRPSKTAASGSYIRRIGRKSPDGVGSQLARSSASSGASF
jgi:hypothetical protein